MLHTCACEIPARVSVFNSAAISIPNNALTALTFDSERQDVMAMHSTVTNTGRITLPLPGWWDVGLNAEFAANATGRREWRIQLNGVTYIAQVAMVANAALQHAANLSRLYYFAANDYIQAVVFQNSGAALNMLSTAQISPEFWCAFRGFV